MRKLTKYEIEEIRLARGMSPVTLAKAHGVSLSTVYRILKNGSLAQRCNFGERRYDLQAPAMQMFSRLVVREDLDAEHALDILKINMNLGNIPAEELPSVGTYNRYLREQGTTRKQMREETWRLYHQLGSEYPNHWGQLDFTVSQQFYIDEDRSIKRESPLSRNKNRLGNKKPRLCLYCYVEDYSRTAYAEFWPELLTHQALQFCFNAWRKKEDYATFPLMGVPENLLTDNDAILKAARFGRAAIALGINHQMHLPGHSWAKGKVENAIKLLNAFQKVTKIAKFKTVEEANIALYDWLIHKNNKKHSATKSKPFQLFYWHSKQQPIRVLTQEALEIRLLNQSLVLPVDNYLRVNLPALGPVALPHKPPFIEMGGRKVEFIWNPRMADGKISAVHEGKEYEFDYAAPQTRSMSAPRAIQKSERQKYFEGLAAVDLSSLKLTGIYASPHEGLYPVVHETKEISTPTLEAFRGPERTFVWAVGELQRRKIFAIPAQAHERAALLAFFAGRETVGESELNEWIQDQPIARSQEVMG